MRPGTILLLMVVAPVSARLPFTTYQSAGVDVSPPRFLEANFTWQFNVTITQGEGGMLIPLFTNRSSPPALAGCSGLVSLCCLWDLADNFINDQLAAYLDFVGACSLHAGERSDRVLDDRPGASALLAYAFPREPPRAWCLAEHRCVFEVPAEDLGAPWLTEELGSSLVTAAGPVTDRRLILSFALVRPTSTPLVQISMTEHTLIFHDASESLRLPSNMRHHSFNHVCLGREKPRFSLWRADTISSNGTCLWFCEPGYLLYPATTDYGLLAPRREYGCLPQPPSATIFVFSLQVDLPPAPGVDDRLYQAEALTALQAGVEEGLGVTRGNSIFYLQLTLAGGGLLVSAAIFSLQCSGNISRQLRATGAAIANGSVAGLLAENLNASFAGLDAEGVGLRVLDREGFRQCPPPHESFPYLWVFLFVVWGCMLLFVCGWGISSAIRGIPSRRRHILQRLSPVTRSPFRV